ncbi:hypothetical protein CCACVL1_09454 [Corchorus capsularis]|uniref:Uncharacterized protein n=1 Tax=Corchorus capsularis TaxID=210143 RepID=A0A1R3IW48_COCAP|nr:hypothetical protein CCACVL1_09454 [Corchorus capsularis]
MKVGGLNRKIGGVEFGSAKSRF